MLGGATTGVTNEGTGGIKETPLRPRSSPLHAHGLFNLDAVTILLILNALYKSSLRTSRLRFIKIFN